MRETDIKKKGLGKFLERTPDIRDQEIRERLNKRPEKYEFLNRANDNNNNNFIPRLPSPPPPPPEFTRQNFPPLLPQPPNLSDFFLNSYIPPPPS